jgi:hypothetical protein
MIAIAGLIKAAGCSSVQAAPNCPLEVANNGGRDSGRRRGLSSKCANDFDRGLTSASGYFDVIRFWLKTPLNSWEGSKLRKLCGVRADTEPAPFPGGYQQRINLRQPSADALNWLAKRDDVHINYIEIALDWTFVNSASREETSQFVNRHLVRRHHGKKQEIQFCEATRYDAGRSAPNLIVFYSEEVSRKTGEIALLTHLEWRARGVQAVRGLGIVSPADLIQFDYRRFWQHRLLLLDASPGRLGRFIRNCKTGEKSRIETPADVLLGNEILEQYNTIQELIDDLGPKYRIRRGLTQIPNNVFLPESEGESL